MSLRHQILSQHITSQCMPYCCVTAIACIMLYFMLPCAVVCQNHVILHSCMMSHFTNISLLVNSAAPDALWWLLNARTLIDSSTAASPYGTYLYYVVQLWPFEKSEEWGAEGDIVWKVTENAKGAILMQWHTILLATSRRPFWLKHILVTRVGSGISSNIISSCPVRRSYESRTPASTSCHHRETRLINCLQTSHFLIPVCCSYKTGATRPKCQSSHSREPANVQ